MRRTGTAAPRHTPQCAFLAARSLVALLLLQALGSSSAAAEDGACPADGSGGEACAAQLSSPPRCIKWRQTGGCDPKGPREKHGDRNCNEEIATGISGYCQCSVGSQKMMARQSTCDHRPFTCDKECLLVLRYTCVSWRQSGGCKADGDREPHLDKPCNSRVDPRSSGYCECGDGRIIRKPGCEHGSFSDAFTCEDECARESDLYEELGVDSSVAEKGIKQAFRKLSLKYHPDKTRNDPYLTTRFAAIREAYEILNDADKRAIYDSAGYKMLDDVKNNKAEKGPAMEGEVKVTLAQVYNGAEFMTQIQRKVICRGCAEQFTERCKQCKEKCANEVELRNVRMGPMVMQQQVEVPSRQKCRHEQTKLHVDIERGMSFGDTLTFRSMGEQQPKKIPGDVVLKLAEIKDKVFRRSGNDLHTDIHVSLKEALLGFERTLTHLDERKLELSYKGVTKPSSVMKVEGEGMPYRGDPTMMGNLLVKLHIDMPREEQLTESHRQWLATNFPG